MLITQDIQKYICFPDDGVVDALKKISLNHSRIIFIVSEHSKLLGSLSDGDVRRWLISEDNVDLCQPVSDVMNKDVNYVGLNADKSQILDNFKSGVECVPILDKTGHLVKLAFKNSEGFCVGNKIISEGTGSFIIAEIGNNHQGCIKRAKELVDHAVSAGVDCVKFQMRNVKELYKESDGDKNASFDLGAQYTMDLLSKFQLSSKELLEVFDYAKSKDIIPLCTPWDLDSLAVLEDYGMEAYKVASADFTNFELLEALALTRKPFFCSTGMSTESEIKETVDHLDQLGANYVLLHCNSTYPTPFKDVNLKYINRLRKISGRLVGYSGHERGIFVPIAAVALGALVIEKHITVDKNLEGTDHKVSLLPYEFSEMVKQIRQLEEGLGSDSAAREVTQGEMLNRENLAKSLVANAFIKEGEIITRDMVMVKSPGQGLQPNKLNLLVGRKANRNIEKDGFFYMTDIVGQVEKRSDYKFNRPFGVPVRYHDFRGIVENTNLDFVEFHLSYGDLEINLDDYFSGEERIGFAIHSPELFSGDHILDLASDDNEYRARSIKELERVIKITKKVGGFFPKTKRPVIVVNAGGWDQKGFITTEDKTRKYNLVSDSLKKVDTSSVTIAIQTMPPFPWHFGGQSYHNLFVSADDIVEFCSNNPEIKICLDISHTMMSCNYYGWDLKEFIEKIANYNVHMHVVDAKGIDGEGVEIGGGDVDFDEIMKLLKAVNPMVQFIPEVWQGHKNGGEGFWKALEFLEKFE